MPKRKRQIRLTDAQRSDLQQRLTTLDPGTTIELMRLRGGDLHLPCGAVVVDTPQKFRGEMSVCGAKDVRLLADLKLTAPDGATAEKEAAKLAWMIINNSPFHVHNRTGEVYVGTGGEGKMLVGVLGEGGKLESTDVVEFGKNTIVLLPPGVAHGLAVPDEHGAISDDRACRETLLFVPPIVRDLKSPFRDEAVLAKETSKMEGLLAQGVEEGVLSCGAVVVKIPQDFGRAKQLEFTASTGAEPGKQIKLALMEITRPQEFKHDTWDVYLGLGGEGKMNIGGRDVDLKKDRYVVIPPGVNHRIATAERDTTIKVAAFSFPEYRTIG